MKALNKSLEEIIQEDIWPFIDPVSKQKATSLIEEIQYTIADLESLNKSLEALRYAEYFSFSLANRLLSIEIIRIRSSENTFSKDELCIKDAYDFKMCLSLVSFTHPKHMEIYFNSKVKYVVIKKKGAYRPALLRIHSIIDRVLQLQMLTFLDPLIDIRLPENFYSFRKGRSSLQLIAYLSRSIQLSDTSRYYLLFADIRKCFDFISHDFILNKFPFPTRHKNLLVR